MSTSSCSGCWVVTVWLVSTPVFVVVINSGTNRVWSHPSRVARVPLHMGGSIPHQGGRCLLIPLPNMEGYLPITSLKFVLANHDPVPWVVALVLRFTIWWHLWAVMSFPQPNVHVPFDVYSHVTLPVVFCHPLWMLQWASMVEFPFNPLPEVLLAGHWVTALPIFSCGIISVSPPVEVGFHWMGLVHLSCAWQTPTHKGMPTSDAMRRSWFWWRMGNLPHWSVTS